MSLDGASMIAGVREDKDERVRSGKLAILAVLEHPN
jgi:hypothetical protein